MNIKHWLSTYMWMAFFVVLLQGCGVVSHPTYEGQVLDIETQEPIEGASVVAIYMTEILTPVDTYSNTIKVKEAVTDSEGRFKIPSYTTIVRPLSRRDDTTFVIYKPGYVSVSRHRIGECFSTTCETRDIPWSLERKDVVYRFSNGKVELQRLHKRRDRLMAIPSTYPEEEKEATHLMKLMKSDHDRYYIK